MSLERQSYLNPKCSVRRSKTKGGHSVYAARAIEKGEVIAVWSGKLVDRADLEALDPSIRRYSLQVEEDLYLVSLTDCEPADLINHSCDPTAVLSGQITLIARRLIRPGEEITYDYATSDGSAYDEFGCGCGAASCRGRVTGDDWSRPDLWERYGEHFSPYLVRRIRALLASDLDVERSPRPAAPPM